MADAFDVGALSRAIPAVLPGADRVAVARWALAVADRAVNEGSRLPFESSRLDARDALQSYVDQIEGTGAGLIVENNSPLLWGGEDDTTELKRLVIRACARYNEVLEGNKTLDSARRQIWRDLVGQLYAIGAVGASIASVLADGAIGAVNKTIDLVTWLAIGAIAVAVIVFSPEIKLGLKAVS